MDHAIDYLAEYMEFDASEFRTEYQSGKYKKMCDCPSYKVVQAYCNAINTLNACNGTNERITPRKIIQRS